jgi:hypothetical protein
MTEADDSEAGLELAPRAARFVQAAVERAYVAWQRDRTMSFNRDANASASFGLVIATGGEARRLRSERLPGAPEKMVPVGSRRTKWRVYLEHTDFRSHRTTISSNWRDVASMIQREPRCDRS